MLMYKVVVADAIVNGMVFYAEFLWAGARRRICVTSRTEGPSMRRPVVGFVSLTWVAPIPCVSAVSAQISPSAPEGVFPNTRELANVTTVDVDESLDCCGGVQEQSRESYRLL